MRWIPILAHVPGRRTGIRFAVKPNQSYSRIRNLIINAATHGKRARVVIDDDGPGIPPEMIGRVFEPFFRAHLARTKHIDGAGLGLTIAHEIVQRAGGSITVENAVSHGLLQIVKLPVDPLPRSGAA